MVEIRAHSPREPQLERKVWAGVSLFRGGMYFKSVSYGRLSSSAYSWLNSYNMEIRARETNDNAAR